MPNRTLNEFKSNKYDEKDNRKQVSEDVTKLEPYFDERASFYGKAKVDKVDNKNSKLYSYGTLVAEIIDGEPVVYDTYSQTTLRHIKEYLKQNGFKADSKKQIEIDYIKVDTVDSIEQAEDRVAEIGAETGSNAYYKKVVNGKELDESKSLKEVIDTEAIECPKCGSDNIHIYTENVIDTSDDNEIDVGALCNDCGETLVVTYRLADVVNLVRENKKIEAIEKPLSKVSQDLKHPDLNKNVKEFYISAFSSDELGGDINDTITFLDVYRALKNKQDIYKVLGVGDSTVRERVFNELQNILGCDKKYIYSIWQYGVQDGQPNIIKEALDNTTSETVKDKVETDMQETGTEDMIDTEQELVDGIKKEVYQFAKQQGLDIEKLRKQGIELESIATTIDNVIGNMVSKSAIEFMDQTGQEIAWDFEIKDNDIKIVWNNI